MPDKVVWFAGEHASPFEELGAVARAHLSGERIAGRMVGRYGLGNGKGEAEA
jgi:hypothetical protein